jgi:hypothetical protein
MYDMMVRVVEKAAARVVVNVPTRTIRAAEWLGLSNMPAQKLVELKREINLRDWGGL